VTGNLKNFVKFLGTKQPLHNHNQQSSLAEGTIGLLLLRLPVVDTLKRYFKALEYEYRVKTAALGTLKRYSILSLTLYLE
jgi:ABC-type phosphate transport system permease subunit